MDMNTRFTHIPNLTEVITNRVAPMSYYCPILGFECQGEHLDAAEKTKSSTYDDWATYKHQLSIWREQIHERSRHINGYCYPLALAGDSLDAYGEVACCPGCGMSSPGDVDELMEISRQYIGILNKARSAHAMYMRSAIAACAEYLAWSAQSIRLLGIWGDSLD